MVFVENFREFILSFADSGVEIEQKKPSKRKLQPLTENGLTGVGVKMGGKRGVRRERGSESVSESLSVRYIPINTK